MNIRWSKGAAFVGLVGCLYGSAAASKPTVTESARLLGRMHPSQDERKAQERVLACFERDPAFRTELVALLVNRLKSYQEPHKGAGEIRAIARLEATEALPALLERWRATPKKTHYLEWADPRVQLLKTVAALQPTPQAIQFLINAMDDEDEAPLVRFRAHILLCASGEPAAIEHVTAAYRDAQAKYPRTMHDARSGSASVSKPRAWDHDGDGLSDYAERGLLLDPTKVDTDGDGLCDGNDRNPLMGPKRKLSDDQQIAQYVFYVYATYLSSSLDSDHARTGPISSNARIVWTTNRLWDSTDTPSVFDGIELTGVDGVVLAMNQKQIERYNAAHGPNSTPNVFLNRKDETGDGLKVFMLNEGVPNAGVGEDGKLMNTGRGWEIRVKKVAHVWLPVYWEMTVIN